MEEGHDAAPQVRACTFELRARMDIPHVEDASIASVAFAPDSPRVAVLWCPDTDPAAEQPCPAQLAVFDRASGRAEVSPVAVDAVADWVPGTLAVSSDRALIAVGRNGGEVEVRDVATLDVLHELDDIVRDGENWVIDTGFSPLQPRLLAASTGDDAAVWDLSGDTPEIVVAGRTGLTTRFTPDGRLITSDQDGTLELRDPTSFEVLDGVEGLPQPVTAPSFTRDGALMVTTDDFTGAARLWRVDGLDQIGGPIDAVFGTIHPAGTAVVVGEEPVRPLTMDPDAWTRAACQTAGRNLTRDEWQRYFADENTDEPAPDRPHRG